MVGWEYLQTVNDLRRDHCERNSLPLLVAGINQCEHCWQACEDVWELRQEAQAALNQRCETVQGGVRCASAAEQSVSEETARELNDLWIIYCRDFNRPLIVTARCFCADCTRDCVRLEEDAAEST